MAAYLGLARWLGSLKLDTAALCSLQFVGQNLLTDLQSKHKPPVHVTACLTRHNNADGSLDSLLKWQEKEDVSESTPNVHKDKMPANKLHAVFSDSTKATLATQLNKTDTHT